MLEIIDVSAQLSFRDTIIERAMEETDTINSDPKLSALYFFRRKALLDKFAAIAQARAEGEAEGKAKRMAEGKAEIICRYLEVRFGAESQFLQETIHKINNLDVLKQIYEQILIFVENEELRKELEVINQAVKDLDETNADPKQKETYIVRKKYILERLVNHLVTTQAILPKNWRCNMAF